MTCLLRNPEPIPYGGYWHKGEPTKSGYYLIRANESLKDEGVPWVYLSRVIVDPLPYKDALYGNNYGYDYRNRAFNGVVVAWAEPTGENFEQAIKEIQDISARQYVQGVGQDPMNRWVCRECGKEYFWSGPKPTEKLQCDPCYHADKGRETVRFVEKDYVPKTVPCPTGCGVPFCIEHQKHIDECGCKP